MEYNKFEEIFGIKNHSQFNSLLIQVDIVSEDRKFLPATRTTKNGFRVGDDRLMEIYKWIRKTIIPSKKPVIKPIHTTEIDFKKKLAAILQNGYDLSHDFSLTSSGEITTREFPEFQQLKIREQDLPYLSAVFYQTAAPHFSACWNNL